MNSADRERLLAKFNRNPPADLALIRRLGAEFEFHLPDAYVQFLQQANGGEGFVGNAYVILWPVGELHEMNKAYEVSKYARGLFLFGSDGGGEAFAFDTRFEAKPIVSVPFVGMDLKVLRQIAPTFDLFLEELSKS